MTTPKHWQYKQLKVKFSQIPPASLSFKFKEKNDGVYLLSERSICDLMQLNRSALLCTRTLSSCHREPKILKSLRVGICFNVESVFCLTCDWPTISSGSAVCLLFQEFGPLMRKISFLKVEYFPPQIAASPNFLVTPLVSSQWSLEPRM